MLKQKHGRIIGFGLRPTYVSSSSFQAAAEIMVAIIAASQNYNYNLIIPNYNFNVKLEF